MDDQVIWTTRRLTTTGFLRLKRPLRSVRHGESAECADHTDHWTFHQHPGVGTRFIDSNGNQPFWTTGRRFNFLKRRMSCQIVQPQTGPIWINGRDWTHVFHEVIWLSRGVVHSKKISYTPQKIRKIRKKSRGFKIRIPYLGVDNSSNSVFKSFFIYKTLVQQKKKFEKSPKNSSFFFWRFKIRIPYLGVNNPSD